MCIIYKTHFQREIALRYAAIAGDISCDSTGVSSVTSATGAEFGKYDSRRVLTASANFSTDSKVTPSASEASFSF